MNNSRIPPLMEKPQIPQEEEEEIVEITAGDLSLDDLIDEQLDIEEEAVEEVEQQKEPEKVIVS